MDATRDPQTAAPTVGELFAGYGGLSLAARLVWPRARVSWVAETDPAASEVLAARFPHAPNLGDVTRVDWASGPEVDVIVGGSPCQDLSSAGRREGMAAGTRSGLWAAMRDAIDTLRPGLVVWENVRGALHARSETARDVEPCQGCVGDGPDPALRALGRVLGDLAALGFDAGWCGLRASDVGACHQRFRVFVLAWPHAADPQDIGRQWGRQPRDRGTRPAHRHRQAPAPLKAAGDVGRLLPTPRASDGVKGSPRQRGRKGDLMLPSAVMAFLPTPTAMDSKASGAYAYGRQHTSKTLTDVIVRQVVDFGQYTAAIQRHEHAFGRTAPPPTEPTGKNGAHRLSPRFVEWMMGLTPGHVTDVGDLTRVRQLTILGNGVVPAQAAHAIHHLLNAPRLARSLVPSTGEQAASPSASAAEKPEVADGDHAATS